MVAITAWISSLPIPAIGTHIRQVAGGTPTKKPFRQIGAGVVTGHIAIPSWSKHQRDILATRLSERADHIEHTASSAGSQIYSDDRLRFQFFQCADVAGREIHYVDIVPHAGPVWRIVIIAVDAKVRTPTHGHLRDKWHQVARHSQWIFAYQSAFVTTSRIEVAQDRNLQRARSNGQITEYALNTSLVRPYGL